MKQPFLGPVPLNQVICSEVQRVCGNFDCQVSGAIHSGEGWSIDCHFAPSLVSAFRCAAVPCRPSAMPLMVDDQQMMDNIDDLFGDGDNEGLNAALAATLDSDTLRQRIEESHIIGSCR